MFGLNGIFKHLSRVLTFRWLIWGLKASQFCFFNKWASFTIETNRLLSCFEEYYYFCRVVYPTKLHTYDN